MNMNFAYQVENIEKRENYSNESFHREVEDHSFRAK